MSGRIVEARALESFTKRADAVGTGSALDFSKGGNLWTETPSFQLAFVNRNINKCDKQTR